MRKRHNSIRYFGDEQAVNRFRQSQLAHYIDGSAGTTAIDHSGYQNHGVLTGGVSWSLGREHRASALSFDGTTGYIDAPVSSRFDLTTEVTLSAWSYVDVTIVANKTVLCKPAATGIHIAPFFAYAITLFTTGDYRMVVAVGGILRTVATPASVSTPGIWQHIAGTYDGVNIKIFVNGVLRGTTAQTGAMDTFPATPLRLAANGAPGEFFPGKLSDFRVYTRALTEAEIFTISNPAFQAILPSVRRNSQLPSAIAYPRNGDFFISGY